MRYEAFRHPGTDVRRFTVEIEPRDWIVMRRLDGFDQRLLDECERSDLASDKLLALELLARRIEEGESA